MTENANLDQRNSRTLLKLGMVVVAMFVFAVGVLPPMYNVFCELTGINGKTNTTAAAESTSMDESRVVNVQFVTRTSGGMPWEFKATTHSVRVHPGEISQVIFHAKNTSDNTVVGQAIPSVSPGLAAPHLLKTQCFCFDNQPLEGGAEADLPMVFYIDPALPKHIHTITLSYTLFDVTERVMGTEKPLAAR